MVQTHTEKILIKITQLFFLALSIFAFFLPISAAAVDLRALQRLGNVDASSIIANVIKIFFGLAGSISLFMFVYGGFLWMTAAGNEDKVKSGKNTLLWASLGIVAMFLSYSAVSLVLKTIGG